MKKGNLIIDLTFQFSLDIIAYTEKLEDQRKYVMAKQLLKSGTSIGANVREAQAGESKNDFIHKLKISEKEAEETEYWLLLCKHASNYPDPGKLLETIGSIKKIIGKIIITMKNNRNN
jgi:four helix bundle protein